MISVWRKLTGKQDGNKQIFPSGVVPIDETMQKKYAKGVQYNMKIIIKGDRNTGKSALFQRLNGGCFKEEYIPTHEIQVTNVNWNYQQGAADIVKVEVWDIVDKSEKKKGAPTDSLKIANDDGVAECEATEGMALDAEFLNVYKGTHGVILTMDITKAWTWQYVQRELDKIPLHIPILVLGNFRDMGDRRVVQTDEIIAHIEHLERPTGSAEVYFSESSMKDGYGLRFAYKYLNMPFLILQRETLLKQLEVNTLEIEETRETLSISALYEDDGYINFKEFLENKDSMSSSDNKLEDNEVSCPDQESEMEENSAVDATVNNLQPLPPLAKLEISGKNLPVATVSPTVHSVAPVKESIFQSYKKKLFGGEGSANESNDPPTDTQPQEGDADFDTGQLASDFLDSSKPTTKTPEKSKVENDSDDDSDDGNPMVAGYRDLDSDDEMKSFEQQFSNEGEFEDLSDDERKQFEDNNVSIIEQIKSERVTNTSVNMVSGHLPTSDDYNDLDNDIHDNDSNTNIEVNIENNNSDRDVIDTVNSNINNVQRKGTITSDDIEDGDDEVYIITGDIDVDDDDSWVTQRGNDYEGGSQQDINHEANIVRPSSSKSSESRDTVKSTSSSAQGTVDFEIDDLEMFMKTQLEKKPNTVEPQLIDEPTPNDYPRPKKKKKKKTNTEEVTVTTEKKKKKKKPVNTEQKPVDTEKKPVNTEKKPVNTEKKPVNTEKKPVKTEEVNEKSSTRKTKKSKSSTSSETKSTNSNENKSKKTRKKETSISELDSFYDGL